jgi:hypothetical protein
VFDPLSDQILNTTDELSPAEVEKLLVDDAGWDDWPDGPSLPVILISAAFGVGAGIIGLYFAYELFTLTLPASAAVGTLSALAVLAGVASLLTQLLDSRAFLANISMSCGLLVLSALFFGVCTLSGAIVATVILSLGG